MDNLFDKLCDRDAEFVVNFKDNDNISLKVSYVQEIEESGYTRQYFSVNAVDNAGHNMGLISFNVENREYIFFGVLLVFKGFGRQGVGSKLVEFMEHVAQQSGVSIIRGDYDAEDNRAEKFYNKKGYKIVHLNECDIVEKCIDTKRINDNISISLLSEEKELSI